MQDVPNHLQKPNSWSCSFQQWYSWVNGYCLSNSHKLWRRMATAHTLVGVQHFLWTKSTLGALQLWFNYFAASFFLYTQFSRNANGRRLGSQCIQGWSP